MKGLTISLYELTQSGTDDFGVPIYTEKAVSVDNVLVGEPSTDDISVSTALYQKTIRFMLGIPKGDSHDWKDKHVSWTDAYGREIHCKTFGYPITGVEANIPGPWHMKVRCEAYEQGEMGTSSQGGSGTDEIPGNDVNMSGSG